MATLSVNGARGKTSKKPSAADLLKAAAKPKTAGTKSPFDYDGNLQAVAGKIIELNRQKDEIDREIDLARDEIRRSVDPWYRDRLVVNGYESSVRVDGGKAGVLRVTHQHRYIKLPASQEEHVREAVGDDYDRFFKPAASLKVRKEIAEDPDRLNDVVLRLAETLGEEFATIFEAEQTIAPTKCFTEQRYKELDAEANAKLELIGVRQVISMAEHKGK